MIYSMLVKSRHLKSEMMVIKNALKGDNIILMRGLKTWMRSTLLKIKFSSLWFILVLKITYIICYRFYMILISPIGN